jgi:hypothetical protein
MDEKEAFGNVHSKDFSIGDIVEWSTWNSQMEKWNTHYGILLTIDNEIRSNRLVSISKVMPMNSPNIELEFFTMSLRLVAHGENIDT